MHLRLRRQSKLMLSQITEMIEDKTQRVGQSSVKVVEMAEDLEDTKEDLASDQKFLAKLETGCATRKLSGKSAAGSVQKSLLPLLGTVRSSTTAMHWSYSRALPGSASFMQVIVTNKEVMTRAASAICASRKYKKDLVQERLSRRCHPPCSAA